MADIDIHSEAPSDEVHHDIEKLPSIPIIHNETQLPQRPSTLKWILTCIGLYLGALLYGLDTTIAADVQASIYEEFGSITKLPWVGIGFPMGSVAVILLIGKIYGMFDIKILILGSIVLFEAGSALCGAAPDINALIVGRVIAGIGGAGMYIGALTFFSVFTSLKERALYNALIGLSWGVGAILGPVIGGAFSVSGATWRWAFYINLPLAALLSPVYLFIFPRFSFQPNESTIKKLKSLDWAGSILNAIVFVLFMVVLTFSGSTWRWNSPQSIVIWILFGVALVSYVVQQVYCIFTTEKDRVFPVHFTKRRTFILMYITTACAAASTSVTLYYVPLFFQFTRGDTALEAAVRLLPYIILYVISIMFAGALLPVVGRYAPWYYPAGILLVVGGSLMFTVDTNTSVGAIYGYEVLIAIGGGLIFQNAYSVVASKVDQEDIPNSIGFVNVAQIGTIAISLSIAGSIFQNVGFITLRNYLAAYDLPESFLRGALAGAQSSLSAQLPAEVNGLVISAVVHTISRLYALVMTAGALTLVCALFMRWEKLKLEPTAGG